jgi:hypothetical protein
LAFLEKNSQTSLYLDSTPPYAPLAQTVSQSLISPAIRWGHLAYPPPPLAFDDYLANWPNALLHMRDVPALIGRMHFKEVCFV